MMKQTTTTPTYIATSYRDMNVMDYYVAIAVKWSGDNCTGV
jgi:hypothetical protein